MNYSDLKIQSFHGLEGLVECGSRWRKVFKASGSDNPFLTWEWNHSWASIYAPHKAVVILVAEIDGQPVGIAPLLFTGNQISFLNDSLFADYADFLLVGESDRFVLSAFLKFCIDTGKKIVLGPVRNCNQAGRLLSVTVHHFGRPVLVESISANPCVCPTSDFDSYMGGRNKRLRQEIRTTINHLDRGGGWEFIESDDGVLPAGMFDSLIHYHNSRQEDKAGFSIFAAQVNREFLRCLPENLVESPVRAHLSAIVWKGRCVSVSYSLVCGDTFYYWIPSFDNTIKGVSLGKLHIKCLLEKCFSHGMKFDFMGGDEPYKFQWANHSYENIRIRIFANFLQKLVAVGICQGTKLARKVKRRSTFVNQIWQRSSKTYMS
jgi:CelD/BcsL family acetyltransferase involved in cellulose biosynthesis